MEAPALASPRSTCLCAAASRAAEDFALFLRALRGKLHLVVLMGWRGFEEGRGKQRTTNEKSKKKRQAKRARKEERKKKKNDHGVENIISSLFS